LERLRSIRTARTASQDRLSDLSSEAALGGQQERLGHLLRDGAPPLYDPPLPEVRDGGAQDAPPVEPLVGEELTVLRGQEGSDHVVRQARRVDDSAALLGEIGHEHAVATPHRGDDGGPVVEKGGHVGKLCQSGSENPGGGDPGQRQDREEPEAQAGRLAHPIPVRWETPPRRGLQQSKGVVHCSIEASGRERTAASRCPCRAPRGRTPRADGK